MRFSPAQLSHAETLLSELLRFSAPADSVISYYFRQHRQIGQADRALIAELCYTVLRHKRSLKARCGDEALRSRHLMLAAMACVWGLNRRELEPLLSESEGKWLAEIKAVKINDAPAAVRYDLPDWLFERLSAQYAEDDLSQLVKSLNQPAPLDLRVNSLKGERASVLEKLHAQGFQAITCPWSPLGIRLADKTALAKHPLFLDGTLEVQDEGSQLLGLLMQPKRGEMVADFCAGAGGKTLLLGALMRSQGRLYAFDISEKRLAKFKPRLARSGLSNVHPILISAENDLKVKRLAGKFDRVLVDAPCSGLGTLRRNPDLKWRQSENSINELSAKQARILHAAAALVKPGGRLVYATCSLLAAENEAVVDAFLEAHPQFVARSAEEILHKQGIDFPQKMGERLQLLPHVHGTDGFFAAVLERQ